MNNNLDLPLVSICIPSYNHEKYIAETINSVILQDYKNIELIIIDDCSGDKSESVINSFSDKCKDRFIRFEYHKNETNKGISYNLNKAIKWAQGKYFYAIASDDILLPFKTSLLVSEIEKLDDSYAAIFGDANLINKNSEEICFDEQGIFYLKNSPNSFSDSFLQFFFRRSAVVQRKEINFNANFDVEFKDILIGNFLPAMSNLTKLDTIKIVKSYTEGNSIEDLEMLFKLTRKYKIKVITKPVALYRMHNKNTAYTIRKKLLEDEIKLLISQKRFALHKKLDNIFYARLQFLIRLLYNIDATMAEYYAEKNGIKLIK